MTELSCTIESIPVGTDVVSLPVYGFSNGWVTIPSYTVPSYCYGIVAKDLKDYSVTELIAELRRRKAELEVLSGLDLPPEQELNGACR